MLRCMHIEWWLTMNAKNALYSGTTDSTSVSTHFTRAAHAKTFLISELCSRKRRKLPKIRSYLFGFKIIPFLFRSGKRKIEAGFQALMERWEQMKYLFSHLKPCTFERISPSVHCILCKIGTSFSLYHA